jgi:predicted AAA+ superfamily ATPase
MKNFKRDIYLQKIKPFINKQLIKVLTGQRRVGKSYLLHQIKEEILFLNKKANIIFINLEKIEFSHIQNYIQLSDYIRSKTKPETNYLFIDEIQDVDGFEKVLRSLVSEPNFDIYCTGSNAKILSGELATYLSGRQIELRVHSLSYLEYLTFYGLENNAESLQSFMRFGGMPYMIHLEYNIEVISEYLQNITNTIIFRDVVARYEIRDVSFLQNLMQYLADNTGSIVSANNISKYLKSQNMNKTAQSIINYIDYIENSFAIQKVKRMDIRGKRIFESGEKYYFEDVGIRNSLVGFNMADVHKMMENVVYNHLVFKGYKVFVGKLNDIEIDFVAEKNGETNYFQVTYLLKDNVTIEREFGNLLKIDDNYPKYVISYDNFQVPNTYKGIRHFLLIDFLTSF